MEKHVTKVTIEYQSERHQSIGCLDNPTTFINYPEDERTPKQRINFIKELLNEELTEHIHIITACPYITEAAFKLFRETYNPEYDFIVDDIHTDDLNDIMKMFAEPMRELIQPPFLS